MRSYKRLHKPTLKPALSTGKAVIATAFALFLVFLYGFATSNRVAFISLALLIVPPILWITLFQRVDRVPHGRILRIEDGVLRQIDATGNVVSQIDATEPFQYRVFGLAEQTDPTIRLYQDSRQLSFYASDPGGLEAIRSIIQIKWPPRPRVSAGYSG